MNTRSKISVATVSAAKVDTTNMSPWTSRLAAMGEIGGRLLRAEKWPGPLRGTPA